MSPSVIQRQIEEQMFLPEPQDPETRPPPPPPPNFLSADVLVCLFGFKQLARHPMKKENRYGAYPEAAISIK